SYSTRHPPPTSTLFPYTTLFRSDEIGAAVLEHGAQQRRERAQHTLRRHAVGLDESRYSLQGVEQEMRVQLRTQRLQLALREALPQLQALDLLALTVNEIGIGVCRDDHTQIEQQHIGKSAVEELEEHLERSWPPAGGLFPPGRKQQPADHGERAGEGQV